MHIDIYIYIYVSYKSAETLVIMLFFLPFHDRDGSDGRFFIGKLQRHSQVHRAFLLEKKSYIVWILI